MMTRTRVRLFLFLLIDVTLWSHAQGETCQSKVFPNQRGNQNHWSGYMNFRNPAECINFCCTSSSCVAVDYDTVNSGCYIFSTPTELTMDASYSYYKVDRVTTPATTTTITTTNTTSTTTSYSTTLTSTVDVTKTITAIKTTTITSTTPNPTTTSTTTTTLASTTTSATTTTTSSFTTTATTKLVSSEKSPETSSSTSSSSSSSSTPDATTTPTTEFSSPLVTEVLYAEQTQMDAGIHTASTGVVAAAVTSATLLIGFGITLAALLLHGAKRKRRQRQRYVPRTASSPPDLFTVSDKPSVTATNYTIYRGYNHFSVSTEDISIKQLPERPSGPHHHHHAHKHQHQHHQHPSSRVQPISKMDFIEIKSLRPV